MLFCCLAAISAGPADALALCVARWQRTAGSARHAPGGVAERSEALDLKEPESAAAARPTTASSATSCSERRAATTELCYRPRTEGPLGRRSVCGYGRRLSALGLGAVPAACRLSALASAGGSVERAICRSRRCFHRAGSVSSWLPPVGRGSWGLMPLAARHTAISPIRAVLRWLPGTAQTDGPSLRQA